MKLLNDVARCNGIGNDEEGYFEDCEKCLRRTAPRPVHVWMMEPPKVIAFWCEYQILDNDVIQWLSVSEVTLD